MGFRFLSPTSSGRSSHKPGALGRVVKLALLAVLLVAQGVESAPATRVFWEGSLDIAYNTPAGANNGANDAVYAVALQNGKAIIGGRFTSYQGTGRNTLARLNTDGSLDAGFNINGGTGPTHAVWAIAVLGDNKVLIGGDFAGYEDQTYANLARLNAVDGSVDTTFNPGSGVGGNVYALVVQPGDQKVLIGGDFTSYNGVARNYVARVSSTGVLETTFNADAASSPDDRVHTIALQGDGRVLIGGYFRAVGTGTNSTDYRHVARLTSSGALDPTFNPTVPAGGVGGEWDIVHAIAVQPDGKILLGGSFGTFQGVDLGGIARVGADGLRDPAFNPGGVGADGRVNTILLLPDGKILIAGSFWTYNGVNSRCIARLYADGTLDPTFDPGAGPTGSQIADSIASLVRQADGRLVAGGDFAAYDGTGRNYVARINAFGRSAFLPIMKR